MVTYADLCGPTAPVAATKTSVGTITVPTGISLRMVGVWVAVGIDEAATTTAAQTPIVGHIEIESSSPGFPKPFKLPIPFCGTSLVDADLGTQCMLVPVTIIPVDVPLTAGATLTCSITLHELPGTGTDAEIGVIMEG